MCRSLGLPLAHGSGGHLLLVGVLAVPPVIALLGTVAALRSRSFRPIVLAIGLCALTGFGLIVMGGNAGVRPVGLQP
ncbi:MAG TPA: hypothetical protein VN618_15140 [Solirubrobacteraceae bacterium]|nr:hypothetical protein [Solirubrobacteraceae bacterium]